MKTEVIITNCENINMSFEEISLKPGIYQDVNENSERYLLSTHNRVMLVKNGEIIQFVDKNSAWVSCKFKSVSAAITLNFKN